MEYVIYTVGNAEFLRAIFNGVTMITTSDSFPTLISIGLMFGILYVCWESVFNATRTFNIQHMLVAVLMYLVMFRPTITCPWGSQLPDRLFPVSAISSVC